MSRGFGNSRNRFGASRKGMKKPELDGYKFDSNEELNRYHYLRQLASSGAIQDLHVKPPFAVTVNGVKIWRARFQPDFGYIEGGNAESRMVETDAGGWQVSGAGRLVIEDWKGAIIRSGADWSQFRAKCMLVKALHGVEVQVIAGGRRVELEGKRTRTRNGILR